MNFRFFNIRVLWAGAFVPLMLSAQTPPPVVQTPPPVVQTPPPVVQTPPQPATQPAAPAPAQQPATASPSTSKKPTVPDYPDPRTLTIGVFYWLALPANNVNVTTGKAATEFETLDNLGKEHFAPGVEVSVPVTRTAVLRFDGFLAKGDGTQDAPYATAPFSTAYNKGDFLSTQYQVTALKLSYDDLLYPFKFPVSKFRLKSLWEVQYIAVNGTFDAPFKPITSDSSGNIISNTISGSKTTILPTFGIAAEYAIAPHVLLRADASGFGFPHRADIWDAEALVSYRRKSLEFQAGFKALHLKTSPKADEYYTDTISGGFVGLLYHWQ